MTSEAPTLEVRNIRKQFPGVVALKDVNLKIDEGEVLAVIGENGAGKSTLMKILAGVQTPDSGEIRIRGTQKRLNSVQDALEEGIALIHQELNLADNLDVGSNIFLGREPIRNGLIDRSKIQSESKRHLASVGLDLSPSTLVSRLPIGIQQMVEITKALSVNARILIMDEPTSSLSQREAENLFRVIRDLKNKGVSILYISHRLGEVKALADRVTVLRDGEHAGDLLKEEIDHNAMVRLMVGRDISRFYQRRSQSTGEEILKVDHLRTPAHPKQTLCFSVKAGEIVGLAGLVGAGRTELLETLFGVTPALEGIISVAGQPVSLHSPKDAIRSGIALVPEDRKLQGLILEMAVRWNLSLSSLKRDQWNGFLNFAKERELSGSMIDRLNVKTPGDQQVVQYLSGGNQQKVVIGKWLAMEPRLLLLDEPTRGIDIGAKQEIYALMDQLVTKGVAILFVSSEMEEILRMSDRALVMHEGRLTGELSRSELSEEAVMQLATGKTQHKS